MSALSDIAMKRNSERTSLEKTILCAPDAIIQEAADELAALRSERDALKVLLISLEWSNVTDMGNFCPVCHAASHRGNHFDDCELAAALAGNE